MSLYAFTFDADSNVALAKVGMPSESVRIAVGSTLEKAVAALAGANDETRTPIQSAGESPATHAIEWAHEQLWFGMDADEPPNFNEVVTERAIELWEAAEEEAAAEKAAAMKKLGDAYILCAAFPDDPNNLSADYVEDYYFGDVPRAYWSRDAAEAALEKLQREAPEIWPDADARPNYSIDKSDLEFYGIEPDEVV